MDQDLVKKYFIGIFLGAGLFLGILVSLQFKAETIPSGSYLTDEIQAKDDLIKDYADEQSYLKSRIVSLREKIDEAQNSINARTDKQSLEQLDLLKEQLGLSDVSGKGVEITLSDSPFTIRENAAVTDEDLIQASDIRDVINIIRSADSTGISLNKQRIIATSTIASVGTTILVNNSKIAAPFIIDAVGDSDLIIQKLLDSQLLQSLYNRQKNGNVVMKISVKNSVSIPVYNEDLKTNFINLVE